LKKLSSDLKPYQKGATTTTTTTTKNIENIDLTVKDIKQSILSATILPVHWQKSRVEYKEE
jgi:hypothetical protein